MTTIPIYTLACPDCGHRYETVVFQGLKVPDKWVCSRCQEGRVQEEGKRPHPLEGGHGGGCPCCLG